MPQNRDMPPTVVEPISHERLTRPNSSPEKTAKAISDLDSLIQALLESLPASKPWQRQLRADLSEADRCSEVLRLVVAVGKSDSDVVEAGKELLGAMLTANAHVAAGRVDVNTRAAVILGFNLAQRIVSGLSK